MKLNSSFRILLLLYIASASGHAQTTPPIIDATNFGIDEDFHMIVCRWDVMDSIFKAHPDLESVKLGGQEIRFLEAMKATKTTQKYQVAKAKDTFDLYFTKLPLVQFFAADPNIIKNKKKPAHFSVSNLGASIESDAGVELRGNSALKYPKKSYDIEIWEDPTSKKSKEITIAPLREDDDWQFNSIYNEPLKLRSYFSNKLWLDIHPPSYALEEPKAKSGSDVLPVEVFFNNRYKGVYLMNEQVDRKQLQLKKYKEETKEVKGELLKASSYQKNTSFNEAPEFNNAFPNWGGFGMKYPFENYEAHYEGLHGFIDFVVNASEENFKKDISKKLDMNNAIDYFLFINLLRGTDNIGKNYFIARYDAKSPYYFIPWDLDGVLGIIQDGKRIETTDDILSNHLFDRLLETNAGNYKALLKERWNSLRNASFSNASLLQRLDTIYQDYTSQLLYEREFKAWPETKPKEDDLTYMKGWLDKRLLFLDSYIKNL